MGEGVKTYQDGSAKRGKWEGGIFTILGDVVEGENANIAEAAKKVDTTGLVPKDYP